MSTCKLARAGDEWHCSCGRQWGLDESDPHPPKGYRSPKWIEARRKALAEMRESGVLDSGHE